MAKILIVDDEPRIRDLIREHLQYAGFTCEEAGDGTAALSVLSQGGIDLVILDIIKGKHTNYPPAGAALADCDLTAAAYLPCEISNRL